MDMRFVDLICMILLVHGVHAGGEEVEDDWMQRCTSCIMTVLHGDREHESINSIDSLTQPSEHACFDLAKHYSSYNVPYRVYIMYAGRNDPLCLHAPRSE